MSNKHMAEAERLAKSFWGECTCLDDYKLRDRKDPYCVRCSWCDVDGLAQALDKARRDAIEECLKLCLKI